MMIRRLALAALVALLPCIAAAQVAFIAPTAPAGDSSDRIANTQFVQGAVGNASGVSIMDFCTPKQASTDITSCAAAANSAASPASSSVFVTQRRTIFFPQQYAPYISLSALTFNTSIKGEGKTDQIQCSNAVTTTCVTLTTTSSSPAAGHLSAEKIGVGFSGTPAAGSTAIKVKSTYSALLREVMVSNAAIGVALVADSLGISAYMETVESCQITDAHLVIDGWPETRITHGRFGCNDDSSNSNDFIRLQNTQGGPSNAPNGLYVDNSQFNLGSGQAGCLLHFVGLNSAGLTQSEWNLVGNHVEDTSSGLCSDANTPSITRLILVGNEFLDNTATHDFFSGLNAATTINDWAITGNLFNSWSGLTLAPSSQINALVFTGNRLNGPQLTITGASNSSIDMEGNFYSGVNLAGSFLLAKVTGESIGGTTVNSATGEIQFPAPTSWTPVLNFGGVSTGVTYSVQEGLWQLNGKNLTYQFQISLSSKGTATGAATITGLPLSCEQMGTSAPFSSAMSSLGGALLASSFSTTISLFESGAGGVGQVFDTNFTNGSTIVATITCLR